jgi:hypothetical protein
MAPILLERVQDRIVDVLESDPQCFAQRTATLHAMDRVVLVARLMSDGRERARELLARDPSSTALEPAFDRIAIFMSEREVVFFLEGRDADVSVRAILNDPVSSTALSPWLPLFDGPLHWSPEVYFWERKGARPS